MLEHHYLTTLFEPKSVAVIGASDRENSVGNVLFRNILDSGYKGRLYPINKGHDNVQGVPAYKSIEEISARVELAIVVTSSLSDFTPAKPARFTIRNKKAEFPRFSGFSEGFPLIFPTVDAIRPSASNSTPCKPASTRR